ncbi:MAG: calcium-binding protein, partial [Planctomycetota bacterium]
LGNGFAEILGTRLDDDLRVYDTRFDGGVIVLNGIRFDFTQLDRISAALGAGDDFYRNFTDDLAPVGGVIEGNAGNDTLRGSFAAETLSGGEGDDQIISVGLTRATLSVGLALGSSGDDDIVHSGIGTVDAGDGNDSVRLEGTPVTRTVEVFTGAGNDYVTAITPGRLVVRTDAGNDTIDLRTSGQATVFAGTGDDLVTYGRIADAQRGSEQIFLQSGDDKAIALGLSASGQALVTGDQGNDTLVQQDGPDLFYDDTFRGGDGTDWIDYGQRRDETIVWTRDNTANDGDTIRGERDDINDDVEYAFGVDDYTPLPINFLSGKVQQIGRVLYLNGTEFNDSVRVERFVDDPRILEVNIGPNGGRFYLPNDDRIDRMEIAVGRGDDDVQLLGDVPTGNVSAGPGDDYVLGGSGNDFIVGGDGRDTLAGATGNDTLRGDAGADRLGGGKKNDLLLGSAGDDRLFGDAGNDTLDGGGNVDRLFGGDGNDDLRGGSSNDKLYGQAGNDTLTGGRGRDLFDGGPGTDIAFLDDEDDPDNVALLTDIENLV